MKKSTRRNFIQSVALGAAALGTSIETVSANSYKLTENKKFPPLKLGIMTHRLGMDWDIETVIKNCTEAGWVHAELRTTHKHGIEVTLNKSERKEIKKRFEDSPLEAISLASAFKYHEPDTGLLKENIEGTKEYLQLAADVGAIGIRVFPNGFVEGVDHEKTMEQIGKALAEVGEYGHNLGVDVKVCVHGQGTAYIPIIRKILDYSGSDHVYVNWNCSSNDTEGAGLKANFDLVKDKIRGIHMHNLDGNYPYREFFKLLRESGYKYYCNAEIKESCEPVRLMNYYRTVFFAFQDEI